MKTKNQKRLEALERQTEYDNLLTKEKLAKLDAGGFAAVKQRARLTKQLVKEVAREREKGTQR
jgi:hypothetical protein